VLQKIEGLIKTKKLEEARKEIKQLRKLRIEKVSDLIVEYTNNIKTEDDYWFYFYIIANVLL
jgi:hypothetical protein